MTIQDYFEALVGQYLEVSGTDAKNQCVDSANFYIKYVLGLPPIEWTNAKDFPSKAGDKYEWIPNGDTNFPKEGDLVIWGGNQWGHIGVCMSGDANKFISFDQNWPTYSACRPVEHTYKSPLPVLGWLRPKVTIGTSVQKDLDTCRVDRDTNHNDRMALYEELGFTGVFNRVVAVEKIKQLLALEKQFVEKDGQLVTAKSQISSLEAKVIELNQKNEELLLTQAKLSDKTALQQKTIEEQGIKIKSLSTSIQELKQAIKTPVYSGWKKALKTLVDTLIGG